MGCKETLRAELPASEVYCATSISLSETLTPFGLCNSNPAAEDPWHREFWGHWNCDSPRYRLA